MGQIDQTIIYIRNNWDHVCELIVIRIVEAIIFLQRIIINSLLKLFIRVQTNDYYLIEVVTWKHNYFKINNVRYKYLNPYNCVQITGISLEYLIPYK